VVLILGYATGAPRRRRRRPPPHPFTCGFSKFSADVNSRRSDWSTRRPAGQTYWPGGQPGFGGQIRF